MTMRELTTEALEFRAPILKQPALLREIADWLETNHAGFGAINVEHDANECWIVILIDSRSS